MTVSNMPQPPPPPSPPPLPVASQTPVFTGCSLGVQEVRVLAEVPPKLRCSKDSWRFNDSRATPGGQIVAGRMNEVRAEQRQSTFTLPRLFECQTPPAHDQQVESARVFDFVQ